MDLQQLNLSSVPSEPIELFRTWYNQALVSGNPEPTAMILSTSSSGGKPSSRIVLLKEFSDAGFIFFTNYHSRKGRELEQNPFVALLFFWPEIKKQVRIEGKAEKLLPERSDLYFKTRPRGSQLGAWASRQSEILESREELEKKLKEYNIKYQNKDIKRPAHWGGFLVTPDKIEFWQEGKNRLHDRLLYTRINDRWKVQRLFP